MAVEIIPSVLARTRPELTKRLRLAQSLAHLIHLDVMDGHFVPSRSVSGKTIGQLKLRKNIEIHLMVKHPERWLPVVLRLDAKRVIVHVELGPSLKNIISLYRQHRCAVIVAINPRTPLVQLKPWIHAVQGVLVMGVHPGKYHAPWQPSTLARIRTIRKLYPKKLIASDGGVSPVTVHLLAQAGVRRLIVGSYLQYHTHPKQAMKALRRLAAAARK